MSLDGVQSVFNQILNIGITISKGSLYNWTKLISDKLETTTYKDIQAKLLVALVINVDESPIKINGEQYYLHNISDGNYTLQYVHKKRGMQALNDFKFFKKYTGILVHDHFSMYYNFGGDNGECNSHILRYLNAVKEFTNHKWAGK